jgi:hypothetical protein
VVTEKPMVKWEEVDFEKRCLVNKRCQEYGKKLVEEIEK